MPHLLRPWSMTDLDNLVKHANNINIAKNLTDKFPFPYTEEAGRNFISYATNTDGSATIFCIEVDGEAAGGIGVHPMEDVFRKNAELGYWLAEPYWGKGIMTAALKEMIDYAFKNYDITRLFARPYGSNVASQKLLEKCGFVLEARFEKTLYKNETFEDELVYGYRKVIS
jgi:[ribosomal protein S5]-alanine N-acetyltransferase